MATPTSVIYAVESGETIYGGRALRPAWRTSMTANTWREIPTTNTLNDLNPKNNPALNPLYPSNPEWSKSPANFAQIIDAWNGACYDEVDDVLWFPLQGGHADYAGNEPYKLPLNNAAPEFVMVRPPSGAIGNLLTTDDGQETTGLYSDGRPRSIHSYNKPVYIPGVGPCIAVQAGTSWNANGIAKPVIIHPITGEMMLHGATYTDMIASKGGACYDPTRHCIWMRHGGSGKIGKYDIATNTWSSPGSSIAYDGEVGLCYLPDDDCIFWASSGSSPLDQGIGVFDCQTLTLYEPNLTGSFVGGQTLGKSQPQWVGSLGAVAVWDNTSSTTVINIMVKPSNPRTGTWTIEQLPVDASNAVTPTVKTSHGTFGRFAYSPKLNGFVLLNATSQKPYFFALD